MRSLTPILYSFAPVVVFVIDVIMHWPDQSAILVGTEVLVVIAVISVYVRVRDRMYRDPTLGKVWDANMLLMAAFGLTLIDWP